VARAWWLSSHSSDESRAAGMFPRPTNPPEFVAAPHAAIWIRGGGQDPAGPTTMGRGPIDGGLLSMCWKLPCPQEHESGSASWSDAGDSSRPNEGAPVRIVAG